MAFTLGRLKGIVKMGSGDMIGAAAEANPNSAAGQLYSTGMSLAKAAASSGGVGDVTGQRGAEGQANLGVDTDLGYQQPPQYDYDSSAMGRRLKKISGPSLGEFKY